MKEDPWLPLPQLSSSSSDRGERHSMLLKMLEAKIMTSQKSTVKCWQMLFYLQTAEFSCNVCHPTVCCSLYYEVAMSENMKPWMPECRISLWGLIWLSTDPAYIQDWSPIYCTVCNLFNMLIKNNLYAWRVKKMEGVCIVRFVWCLQIWGLFDEAEQQWLVWSSRDSFEKDNEKTFSKEFVALWALRNMFAPCL